jgi:hypothetical protein
MHSLENQILVLHQQTQADAEICARAAHVAAYPLAGVTTSDPALAILDLQSARLVARVTTQNEAPQHHDTHAGGILGPR